MKRRWTLAFLAATGLAGGAAAAAETIVLLPLQRSTRDVGAATAVVEQALYDGLRELGDVADPVETRNAMRRLRLRSPERAGAEQLRRLGGELGAAWLFAAALQDAPARTVPDLSISARLYDAASGELVWAGFAAASGLDSRTVLGLGVRDRVEALAPVPVRRLLAASPLTAKIKPVARAAAPSPPMALVPFTAYLEKDALSAAVAATEAARAALLPGVTRLASPECVEGALQAQQSRAWGELSAAARGAIRDACGVDLLVTGSVERWEIGGPEAEPKPIVALALRLLDAASGKILWMGSREATGWDGQGLFGLGRVYSRGALLERLLSRLSRELLRAGSELRPAIVQAERAPLPEPEAIAAAPAEPGPELETTGEASPQARSQPPAPGAQRQPEPAPQSAPATRPAAAADEIAAAAEQAAADVAEPAEPTTDEIAAAPPPAARSAAAGLVETARAWLGRGVRYDPSYVAMDYPGGKLPTDRGAAIDLVVRAFRGIGVDLQQRIHEDILRDRAAYGYRDRQPDTNVSHRRLRNLAVFMTRNARQVSGDDYRPGDVVLWDTDGNRDADHVGIVSSGRSAEGGPLVIHHRRPGGEFAGVPSEDDVLRRWPITACFRWLASPAGTAAEPRLQVGITDPAAGEPKAPPAAAARPRAAAESAEAPEPAASRPLPPSGVVELVEGARAWLGRGVRYDAGYVEMDYPGGDPPADRGAAVDLVVRAFRSAGLDLQQAVHEDIVGSPAAYGYVGREPDTNLSHRRLRNLVVFLARNSKRVEDGDYRAGDVVLWDTNGDGDGDHVGIVSSSRAAAGLPLVIHHRRPGAGFSGEPSEDDILRRWPVAAHFRAAELLGGSPGNSEESAEQ